MKLLFDENLSRKLVPLVEDLFPGSAHISRVGTRILARSTRQLALLQTVYGGALALVLRLPQTTCLRKRVGCESSSCNLQGLHSRGFQRQTIEESFDSMENCLIASSFWRNSKPGVE